MTGEFWSLDIPGLGYEQAVRIRDHLMPEVPAGVVLLDPATFMVRGFDRMAARLMVQCLKAGIAGVSTPEDRAAALSMLEDFQAWLEETSTD